LRTGIAIRKNNIVPKGFTTAAKSKNDKGAKNKLEIINRNIPNNKYRSQK
tara:strand:+ start:467 stop:616 length:150 start_codon:yes stop_codon:yes gene_type:complete